jgi:hypothetical protein
VSPRRALLLVGPTVRSTDWLAPTAAAILAIAVDRLAGRTSDVLGLELAAIALAVGIAFALDDPAAGSLAACPASLAIRNAVRVACVVPLPAGVWLALVLRSGAAGAVRLTPVAAGLSSMALAIAATRVRAGESGGLAAGPAVLALVSGAGLLPERLSLFPDDGRLADGSFGGRWGLVLVLSVVTYAAASRDPAARRLARPGG